MEDNKIEEIVDGEILANEKPTLVERLLKINPAIYLCIFFTAATLLDLILSVATGAPFTTHGSTYQHLFQRFIIVTFIAASLLIFRIPLLKRKLPLWAITLIHFAITAGVMLFSTFINGLFVELHPRAYRYIFQSLLLTYPGIAAGCLLIHYLQKYIRKKRNK